MVAKVPWNKEHDVVSKGFEDRFVSSETRRFLPEGNGLLLLPNYSPWKVGVIETKLSVM